MKRKIKIEIFSDVVCPWCYLGENRLQKAILAKSPQFEVSVHYRPFELNPELPENGVNQLEHLSEKFGSKSRVEAVHAQLTNLGEVEGVPFNFDKVSKLPNTFKAHRLIWLADKYGVQEKVVKALFSVYFAKGEDVGDETVLIKTGIDNGIPAEKLQGFFSSDEGLEAVRQLEQQAYQLGIQAVPSFVINDQFLVRGAQESNIFEEVLEKAAPPIQEIVSDGKLCEDDDCDVVS
jgi:predicted DsbA family dithiol-disulfide isomerase